MDERLLMPKVIYGSAGIEMNVYFSNIFETLNPANFAFHFHCSRGSCCDERWHFTPTSNDRGCQEAKVEIFDDNGLQAAASCRLIIRDPAQSAGKKVKLLMIGDSLTDQSHYPVHIHTLCKQYGIALEMLGTNIPENLKSLPGQLIRYPESELLPGVRHEGYGGWTAGTFLTRREALKTTPFHHWHCASPFLNGCGEFDFKGYLEKNCSGQIPDIIMIGLGTNDLGAVDADNHKELTAKYLENMTTLYEKLHADVPDALFGIVLNPYGTATQAAWGKNYGSSRFRRNIRHFLPFAYRELEQCFASKENCYIVPLYHAIDPYHGYPEETSEAFSGSNITVTRQCNALHPSPAGYRQLGAAAFSWLMDVLESRF